MTLTESATRSSAASHCLMSSAVTQMGRLPRNTVKLIQFVACTPLDFCWPGKRRRGKTETLVYLILTDDVAWCNGDRLVLATRSGKGRILYSPDPVFVRLRGWCTCQKNGSGLLRSRSFSVPGKGLDDVALLVDAVENDIEGGCIERPVLHFGVRLSE